MAIQQQQKEADPAARQQAASGLAAARGAAPTPGVAPSPEVAPSPQPASVPVLRRYCPHTDHAAVVEICRDVCDVYGGSDDLPQRINEEAARPCTHALALATGGAGAPLDALLCCQLRGDVLWVYGARTRGSLRGLGMASRLLVSAHRAAAWTATRAEHACMRPSSPGCVLASQLQPLMHTCPADARPYRRRQRRWRTAWARQRYCRSLSR